MIHSVARDRVTAATIHYTGGAERVIPSSTKLYQIPVVAGAELGPDFTMRAPLRLQAANPVSAERVPDSRTELPL